MQCIVVGAFRAQCAFMLSEQIGANIKAARKAKSVSLQKLAAKVRPATSYQHLSRLEKGGPALTIQWVEKIAAGLGVDPIDLIVPDRAVAARDFHLDEQVAIEAAQTLSEVALQGAEPEAGTVQAVALILQELTAMFSKHPQTALDVQVARPVIDLAARRFGPAAS